VVARDANSAIWERTVDELGPAGQIIPRQHRYTELATGLNHWVNGQWVASQEEIDVSADGNSAAATNGQHLVYFTGDIANEVVELDTPDALKLESRPIALGYDDSSNTVLFAILTNAAGAILPSRNQVIYQSAFTGVAADLLYTYTKAGFEQDIILRAQPPTPESFGLNPQTARLQVLTEFFNPPQPTITSMTLPEQAGISMTDENLNFGVMEMIRGRAFLLGSESQDGGVSVSKSWVQLDGRQFLVEEVPVAELADELAQLPVPQTASVKPNPPLNVVSAKRLLPPQRIVKTNRGKRSGIQFAQAAAPVRGLVLDYVTVSSQTGYTFQGDTTYYISGRVNLNGTNTFEGGAVLKYNRNASANVTPGCCSSPTVIWLGSAYRPVIFTAMDDNSVGETITNSTGTPTNYYASTALEIAYPTVTPTISYFRIAYASQALCLMGGGYYFYNGQILNCQNGITDQDNTQVYPRNVLFGSVQTDLNDLIYADFDVENCTFNSSAYLTSVNQCCQTSDAYFTNCIFANVSALTNNPSLHYLTYQIFGTTNGFYDSPEFGAGPVTNSFYPFQTVGAGNYYLTNGCAFRNAGTTNVDPNLLASLATKTTYPPFVYSNTTISTPTTFNPQAQRDAGDTPDLGYHYDALDYITDELVVTNAPLTIANGTAIACYNRPGIALQDGSSMVSVGSAVAPNWLVRYQSVQEQSVSLGGTNVASGQNVSAAPYGNVGPTGTFQFTHFASPAAGGWDFYHRSNSVFSTLTLQNDEL
jgi:hypothetical protein